MAWARLSSLGPLNFCYFDFLILLVHLSSYVSLQDLKETSRLKSGFIHATKGGWEQVPILQD